MQCVSTVVLRLKHGAILYNKAEVFSLSIGTLSTFVEDENENEIMTWHALGHWDENIVFGAKIES